MRRYLLREEEQIYFLHVPKTGGMSLMHTIYDFFPDNGRPHYLLEDLIDDPDSVRQRPFIAGHTYFTIHHFLDREPLYVTMLREPVARVISLFRHIQRLADHPLHEKFRDTTLLEFLRSPEGENVSNNMQTFSLAIDDDPRTFFKARMPSLRGEFGRSMKAALLERMDEQDILELAKSRLEKFAFIGLTERFAASIDLLTYTFHWQPIQQAIHFNFDPERPTAIPQEVRDLIAEQNQLDAQLYRLGQELMERRQREMMLDLLKTDHEYHAPELSEDSRAHAAKIDTLPEQSVPFLKDSRGWSDRWVGPRWVLSGNRLPLSLKTLEITGEIFPNYFKTPLKLTILVDGKVFQLLEVAGKNFSISVPLNRAPIEILADQYFIPAQLGNSPDHRPLSWLVERINLKP